MNRIPVNKLNWRNNQNFKDWLALEFDLHDAPKETIRHIVNLLPVAVSMDRLLKNIQDTVLDTAMEQWNRPVRTHWFYPEHTIPGKVSWRYLGTATPTALLGQLALESREGRLRHSLTAGQYCEHPNREVEESE